MEVALLLDHPPPIRTIGVYDLVAEIARVGMTDVYFALAPLVDGRRARVVIKRFFADDLDDEDYHATFLDEARLARTLRHPNIVKTIEVGRDGRSYFIVMEFLDGQPLSRMRRHARGTRRTPLPIELRIVSDVLAGLAYMHDAVDDDGILLDIVHREVTPQNLFITYGGEAKIIDFGLAKSSVCRAETRVGVVKGTLSYLAPETVSRRLVDPRSDIFAVGVLLWEGATGRRFWDGISEASILARLVSGDLPTTDAAREMPAEVFEIVKRALAPDPADRFATAREMLETIEPLLADRPEGSTQAVSAYVERLFIEERRGFYQSARAAVARLERREYRATRETAPPAPASEETSTEVSSHDERQNDLESTETGPAVTTSFASQSLAPPTIAQPPASRRIALGLGGAALVSVVWLFARGHLHERHHVAQEMTSLRSGEVDAPGAASTAPSSISREPPAPSIAVPTASSSQPPQPKARPSPSMHRPAPPKSRPPRDQFGI